MGRLGLGLGSRPYVVCRLWSGMGASVGFRIIPRPVGRLGLSSEPHVVGRLGSGPRVGAAVIYGGIFGMWLSPACVSREGCYLLECRHVQVSRRWTKSWRPVASRFLDTLSGLRVMFLRTWRSTGTSICPLVLLLVPTGDDALVDPVLDG